MKIKKLENELLNTKKMLEIAEQAIIPMNKLKKEVNSSIFDREIHGRF